MHKWHFSFFYARIYKVFNFMNEVKPPEDASDFLMVFYRASSDINPGANSASEFD